MRKKNLLFFLIASFIPAGCTLTSKHVDVREVAAVEEDKEYNIILEKNSRYAHVYSQLQSLAECRITLMTPIMFDAYKGRKKRILGDNFNPDPHLDLPENRLNFVVSFFASQSPFLVLDNKKIWNISVKIGENRIEKLLVQPYRQKQVLAPYFDLLSAWSRDYVFSFPLEQLKTVRIFDANGKLEVPVVLKMSSSLTDLTFKWTE